MISRSLFSKLILFAKIVIFSQLVFMAVIWIAHHIMQEYSNPFERFGTLFNNVFWTVIIPVMVSSAVIVYKGYTQKDEDKVFWIYMGFFLIWIFGFIYFEPAVYDKSLKISGAGFASIIPIICSKLLPKETNKE
ncbi:hypothetical protein [Mannheimia varigena]|uniref:hypothetical protein n=1 Tax=Mannheimia varigena TaxID=85404 RepID=UPI0003E3BF19|nr:hypothetical protein [Mannheimia varigena]AHG77652.1 hypothetical protein X874_10160 [Mannheimia varigena USDA-ARS-USMARC-1312]